jgi:hypothetical protein
VEGKVAAANLEIIMVKQDGNEWIVTDSSGRQILGRHKTKKKANAQLAAIEISKKKRGK